MYIVRYADDFKIFCRNYKDAQKAFEATKKWLKERLKLDISPEKSKIVNLKDVHCHHIIPKNNGGNDRYTNLILVTETIHILIHATQNETVRQYLDVLKLTKKQIEKLNKLRKTAGNQEITM